MQIPEYNEIFVKYFFVHGQDWDKIAGLEEGSTQIGHKSINERLSICYNFPLEITFKSTCPFGCNFFQQKKSNTNHLAFHSGLYRIEKITSWTIMNYHELFRSQYFHRGWKMFMAVRRKFANFPRKFANFPRKFATFALFFLCGKKYIFVFSAHGLVSKHARILQIDTYQQQKIFCPKFWSKLFNFFVFCSYQLIFFE